MIELVGLCKNYDQRRSLDRVDLKIEAGQVFGYVGPNGAGKTTTIKILAGLVRPSAGDALICGKSVSHELLAVRSLIGYLPESGALFEKLTPREFLTAMGELHTLEPSKIGARIEELLAFFSLSDRVDQRMDTFSKGMKQKVCWCSALLHEPQVLLLDEPLNGLDAEAVLKVKDLLRAHAAAGKTVFYASHLLDIVEKVCDRVAALANGRVLAVGTPAELIASRGASSLEAALVELWRQEPG